MAIGGQFAVSRFREYGLRMPLKLEIVSQHRDIVGDDAVHVFRDKGGTIGRSLQNDWTLPDPERYISGRHATIDFKGGAYLLADTSSNGVYINDKNEPIGKGNPRRLFNGDRLRMGNFEFTVEIDEGEDLRLPKPPRVSVAPDNIEQLLPELTPRSGIALLDEDEITEDKAFQSTLFGIDRVTVNRPLDSKEPPPPPPKITADDLFDCLLDGLGLSRTELPPQANKAEIMQNAGEVLREFVAGTNKLIANRAEIKDRFHLTQTTRLPRQNNPLKLSENTANSIKQVLVSRAGEYLGPRDAVREICCDLLFHQNALLDAMATAVAEFAEQFDPEDLQADFDRSLNDKPRISALNRLKYWEMYAQRYPALIENGGSRFPQALAESFVNAYERAVNHAKYRAKPTAPKVQSVQANEQPRAANLPDANSRSMG